MSTNIKVIKSMHEANKLANDSGAKKYRVRFDSELTRLPDDTPMPDMLIDAHKVEINGASHYMFTDVHSAKLNTYVVPEALANTVFESQLEKTRTTDPFGSLNPESVIYPSVEHSDVEELIKRQERLSGAIALCSVDLKEGIQTAWTKLQSGEQYAKRVIFNNAPVFLIDDPMDNYSRPTLVSANYLESKELIVKIYSPEKEKSAQRERLEELQQEKIKNQALRKEQENQGRIQKENEYIKTLLKPIEAMVGHEISVDDGRLMKAQNLKSISDRMAKFKVLSGSDMQMGFLDLEKVHPEKFVQHLASQSKKILFEKEHGFLLQANKDNGKYTLSISKDGAVLGQASVADLGVETMKVTGIPIDDYSEPDVTEIDVDTLRFDPGENSAMITEMGREWDDDGNFNEFWYALSEISFIDYDGLAYSSVDDYANNDPFDLSYFDSEVFMDFFEENHTQTLSKVSEKIYAIISEIDKTRGLDKEGSNDMSSGM